VVGVFTEGWGKQRRNDIQHNDIQHSDIQHNDIQHRDIQHNDSIIDLIVSLSIKHVQHNDTQHTYYAA
jgi:hypothetical protein